MEAKRKKKRKRKKSGWSPAFRCWLSETSSIQWLWTQWNVKYWLLSPRFVNYSWTWLCFPASNYNNFRHKLRQWLIECCILRLSNHVTESVESLRASCCVTNFSCDLSRTCHCFALPDHPVTRSVSSHPRGSWDVQLLLLQFQNRRGPAGPPWRRHFKLSRSRGGGKFNLAAATIYWIFVMFLFLPATKVLKANSLQLRKQPAVSSNDKASSLVAKAVYAACKTQCRRHQFF